MVRVQIEGPPSERVMREFFDARRVMKQHERWVDEGVSRGLSRKEAIAEATQKLVEQFALLEQEMGAVGAQLGANSFDKNLGTVQRFQFELGHREWLDGLGSKED